jgi:DUSP domain
MKRKINHEVISMDLEARRRTELEGYHRIKQNKQHTDSLYLIDRGWIESWLTFLRGTSAKDGEISSEPDYIRNERIFKVLYEDPNPTNLPADKLLKMDKDFIVVHKTLFEYLYGVYGCDYFILAKQLSASRAASKDKLL